MCRFEKMSSVLLTTIFIVLAQLGTLVSAQTSRCPVDASRLDFTGLAEACEATRPDLCESCVCYMQGILVDAGYDPTTLNLDNCALDNLNVLLENGATLTAFLRVSSCRRDDISCRRDDISPAPPPAPPMPSEWLRNVTEAFGNVSSSASDDGKSRDSRRNVAQTTGVTLSVLVFVFAIFAVVFHRFRCWRRRELRDSYASYLLSSSKSPIELAVKCTCAVEDRILLQDVDVKFASGQMCGIMGPSGCGKTTLLNAIVHGELLTSGSFIEINGTDVRSRRDDIAFVEQYVPLCPAMTVFETIHFNAMLRLPWFLSAKEIAEKAMTTIEQLGLSELSQRVVGSVTKKLSGGEARRVAIAQEMVVDPPILVLDEPASGLDAHTSWHLFSLLSTLAHDDSKLVISTVHQPSSRLFYAFDKIVILARNGSIMWAGNPHHIDETLRNIGMEPQNGSSTPEWLLHIASDDALRISFIDKMEKYNSEEGRMKCEATPSVRVPPASSTRDFKVRSVISSSSVLLWREFIVVFRDKRVLLSHYVTSLIIAILLGLLSDASHDLEGFQNRMGSIFFMLVYYALAATTIIEQVMDSRTLAHRQIRANLYSGGSFYLIKLAIDWIVLRIPACLSAGAVYYFLFGLRSSFTAFATYMGFLILFSITQSAICACCAFTFRKASTATLTNTCILLMSAIFAGYLINAKLLPTGSRWLTFLSPFYYAWGGILASEMRDPDYLFNADFDGETVVVKVSGTTYLNVIGVQFNYVGRNFIGLCGLSICTTIMGALIARTWGSGAMKRVSQRS